jgi:GNAT superfamily N-acetyltransferase
MSRGDARPEVTLSYYPSAATVEAVIALADANKATLGLMPAGAIRDLAERGDVLTAVDTEGSLAGYAMFSIAYGRIRLIHLCVAPEQRGNRIAQRLVRKLADDHRELAGILVRCRRDYADATRLWKSLDFRPRTEVRGRGRDGATLLVWWLSNSIPDLFTIGEEPLTTPIAIDHNVFKDLTIDRDREGAEQSQSLEADWLREQITLKVTTESSREAADDPDPARRTRHLNALAGFEALDYPPSAYANAKDRWDRAVGPVPAKDRSDCNHIISAAAAGVTILVTRDDAFVKTYGPSATDVFGIRLLHPQEVIVHLDELADASRYQPADLRGTGFQVALLRAGAEQNVSALIDNAGGERRKDFNHRLHDVAADDLATRWWVRDPAGSPVAVWATAPRGKDGELEVPLLRFASSKVGLTVGRLITFQLRQDALAYRMNRIRISDPHISQHVRSDLLSDGYRAGENGVEAAVLDVRSRSEALAILDGDTALGADVRDALVEATAPEHALALERALWPAKLLDSELPSYLVPIQPVWARQLFALSDTLWVETGLLTLSREHVYYRTPGRSPKAPARIAWYASDTGKRGIGAVVAVSHLVEVDSAHPERLYARYRRLGVYGREHVLSAARDEIATALRFVDTENLRHPVPYDRLWNLPGAEAETTLQSPLEISARFFGSIYEAGTRRRPIEG